MRFDGIGVRRATDVACPAYMSSVGSSALLVGRILYFLPESDLDAELCELAEAWKANTGIASLPAEKDRLKQRAWDDLFSEDLHAQLLSRADQYSRARLLAAASAETGLWLHAIPVPSLGTALDPETLRIAIALRVGSKILRPDHSWRCRCGKRMDCYGYHPLSCQRSSGRFPRHAALNDIVRRAMQGSGFPSVLEPVGLSRNDGKRPDGMTSFPFKGGKSLV